MSSTWIVTPPENAKEVVERYINDPTHGLTIYSGATLSYDPDCEVYLDYNVFMGAFTFNPLVIYFGFLSCGGPVGSEENALRLSIDDGSNDFTTFDAGVAPVSQCTVPLIWNNGITPSTNMASFIGYKFNVILP